MRMDDAQVVDMSRLSGMSFAKTRATHMNRKFGLSYTVRTAQNKPFATQVIRRLFRTV